MKSVFLLQHSYERSETGEEETKLIGVYSNKEKAQEAKTRLSLQSGFKDFPENFFIDEYEIDQDNWRDGFILVEYLSSKLAEHECDHTFKHYTRFTKGRTSIYYQKNFIKLFL